MPRWSRVRADNGLHHTTKPMAPGTAAVEAAVATACARCCASWLLTCRAALRRAWSVCWACRRRLRRARRWRGTRGSHCWQLSTAAVACRCLTLLDSCPRWPRVRAAAPRTHWGQPWCCSTSSSSLRALRHGGRTADAAWRWDLSRACASGTSAARRRAAAPGEWARHSVALPSSRLLPACQRLAALASNVHGDASFACRPLWPLPAASWRTVPGPRPSYRCCPACCRSDSGAWMTWLQAPGTGPVTTLAWHPQVRWMATSKWPGLQKGGCR